MSQEPEHQAKESDFHREGSHKIPYIIRLAWTIFFIYMFGYGAYYVYPSLKDWLH